MRSSCSWVRSSTIVSSGQISSRTNWRIQSSFSWNSGSVEKSHAIAEAAFSLGGSGRPLCGEAARHARGGDRGDGQRRHGGAAGARGRGRGRRDRRRGAAGAPRGPAGEEEVGGG